MPMPPSTFKPPLHPLHQAADLGSLLEAIGNARIVMLGEASHGTHDYYTWRMKISRRLIQERGFNFIAVEGDWPDCYKLNRFVKNYPNSGQNAEAVLRTFERWPSWMWANWEMVAFIDWLRAHNSGLPLARQCGFYGLDVYSLWESLDAVMAYLQQTDPEAAAVAHNTISCLEPYRDNEGGIAYARALHWIPENCEKEVLHLLHTIRYRTLLPFEDDPEGAFSTAQNARIAVNAEKYYRIMTKPGPHSWNHRDKHMMSTLSELLSFYGPDSKAIVWAHNTHIGDARFTDMAASGMWNIGQLAREQYGEEQVRLLGFGSYQGSVTAGGYWGAPMENMPLPPAKPHSWEHLLCPLGSSFYLLSEELAAQKLPEPLPHRAVGVVYDPGRDSKVNYVPSQISRRYDAFLFFRDSRALHPLRTDAASDKVPETYPWNF
jgi:erythromycin esterase